MIASTQRAGFTDLTITNDQLTLSSANRGHGINRFCTGITGLMNTFSGNNTRCQYLDL